MKSEVWDMLYKRHEYFRHLFRNPLDATFRILLVDGAGESNPGTCRLLDISPGGTKIYSNFDMPDGRGPLHLRLTFTLFQEPLTIEGEIVWKKKTLDGYQYGIDFIKNPTIEKLIVDELKLRRQTEISATDT